MHSEGIEKDYQCEDEGIHDFIHKKKVGGGI
jgi:hypothetical protein